MATTIWDPVKETVPELGREYTFIAPSARDAVAINARRDKMLADATGEPLEAVVGNLRAAVGRLREAIRDGTDSAEILAATEGLDGEGDAELSNADNIELAIMLVQAGVAEFRDDPQAAERLAATPLQVLSQRVMDRMTAMDEYAEQQKKT